jgi:hypothetical protein
MANASHQNKQKRTKPKKIDHKPQENSHNQTVTAHYHIRQAHINQIIHEWMISISPYSDSMYHALFAATHHQYPSMSPSMFIPVAATSKHSIATNILNVTGMIEACDVFERP